MEDFFKNLSEAFAGYGQRVARNQEQTREKQRERDDAYGRWTDDLAIRHGLPTQATQDAAYQDNLKSLNEDYTDDEMSPQEKEKRARESASLTGLVTSVMSPLNPFTYIDGARMAGRAGGELVRKAGENFYDYLRSIWQ